MGTVSREPSQGLVEPNIDGKSMLSVGDVVVPSVREAVGAPVGLSVGLHVGLHVGLQLGFRVGLVLGTGEGAHVGKPVDGLYRVSVIPTGVLVGVIKASTWLASEPVMDNIDRLLRRFIISANDKMDRYCLANPQYPSTTINRSVLHFNESPRNFVLSSRRLPVAPLAAPFATGSKQYLGWSRILVIRRTGEIR